MTFLLLLLLFLLVLSPDFSSEGRTDALSHERMLPWKGVCVFLILLSHYTGYIQTDSADEAYLLIRSGMGQSVVVLFFFAAGYGMMLQLKRQGRAYLPRILKKALRLWLLCALSVVCMLGIQLLRGREYDLSTILMAFIPLVSLGNSPWFVFAMIACYLFFLLSALPCILRPSAFTRFLAILLGTALTSLYVFLLMRSGFDEYWYDTVLLFPAGLFCAFAKDLLPEKQPHGMLPWLTMLTASVTAVCFLYCYHTRSFLLHELYMAAVCWMIVTLALRWTPGSRLLRFLGRHALVIYLFERVPMIILYETGLLDMVPHLGFFPVLCFALLLAGLEETLGRQKSRKEAA